MAQATEDSSEATMLPLALLLSLHLSSVNTIKLFFITTDAPDK
jgi:hypothetical protein